MRTSSIVWIVVLIIVIGGGWYLLSHERASQNADSATPGPSQAMGINGSPNQGNLGQSDTDTPQQPQGDGTPVGMNLILGENTNATLGDFLSGYNGMTVYVYDGDSGSQIGCTGACAQAWPPYTVPSKDDVHVPATITGVVGTLTRPDGSLQVTYNGRALYFYANDSKPGDATGNGLNGGKWHAVRP